MRRTTFVRKDLTVIRPMRDNGRNTLQGFGERLKCVPRILSVQNHRMGEPLNQEDLADVTQEALLVIWRKLASFERNTLFESWAYRICFLELMNYLRKTQRRRRLMDEAAQTLRLEPAPAAPVLPRTERYELVHLALAVLETEEAAIVRMRHFDDETFEQVGRRLDIPTGTAKTRYYRALTKLRDYVRNHDRGGDIGTAAQS